MFDALIAIAISAAIGGALWYIGEKTTLLPPHIRVSKRELLIGTAISAVVLMIAAPLTEYLIVQSKVTFHEYYNGYEISADQKVTNCERDGDCSETYSCDPYIVMVTYTTTDSEGHTHTHIRPETRYHHCPYLKQEFTYSITTTLGTTHINGTYSDSRRERYRNDEEVPNSIPTGPPTQWVAAKDRIDNHKNGGATEVHDYTNYLLASDKTILDSYSQDIEQYSKDNMLPGPTHNYKDPIYDNYKADKFQTVRLNTDTGKWNEYLLRFNGYLGKQLQGDVHMLAVDSNAVKDRDRYAQALFAHWKDPKAFGRDAISKNAIALVVGIKDNKVEWARATGGLPIGNEGLFLDIQNNLPGKEFTPDTILGIPNGEGKAFNMGTGVLAATLWGQNKFKRPCMECIEENQDGYNYLKNDTYVTGGQKATIIIIAVLLSAGMWAVLLYIDDRTSITTRWPY